MTFDVLSGTVYPAVPIHKLIVTPSIICVVLLFACAERANDGGTRNV